LGYAIGAIVANRKLHDVPAGGVIGVSMIFASLVYAPLSLPNLPGEMAATSLESLLAVIILGLICSAAAFVLFFMLIREVGPAKSTLITFLNTAVALILGIVFLGEPITTGLVIGIPLIATGLWLAGGGELESELSKA
jgi:drug/metabolite transporter (DMT)-like permease